MEDPTGIFGLVVDDRDAAQARVEARRRDDPTWRVPGFLDPWNNRIEIVEYGTIQLTKAAAVLAKLGVDGTKTEFAERWLRK